MWYGIYEWDDEIDDFVYWGASPDFKLAKAYAKGLGGYVTEDGVVVADYFSYPAWERRA